MPRANPALRVRRLLLRPRRSPREKTSKSGIPKRTWLDGRNDSILRRISSPEFRGLDSHIRDPTTILTDCAGYNNRSNPHSCVAPNDPMLEAHQNAREGSVIEEGSWWLVAWEDGNFSMADVEQKHSLVFVHGLVEN